MVFAITLPVAPSSRNELGELFCRIIRSAPLVRGDVDPGALRSASGRLAISEGCPGAQSWARMPAKPVAFTEILVDSPCFRTVRAAAIDKCGTNRSNVARFDPSTSVTTFFPAATLAGG